MGCATNWGLVFVALLLGATGGIGIMALMQMAGSTSCPDDSGNAEPADVVR